MPLKSEIFVRQFDCHGNYTIEKLPVNDAILRLLRFARKFPNAVCSMELRELQQPPLDSQSAVRKAAAAVCAFVVKPTDAALALHRQSSNDEGAVEAGEY